MIAHETKAVAVKGGSLADFVVVSSKELVEVSDFVGIVSPDEFSIIAAPDFVADASFRESQFAAEFQGMEYSNDCAK